MKMTTEAMNPKKKEKPKPNLAQHTKPMNKQNQNNPTTLPPQNPQTRKTPPHSLGKKLLITRIINILQPFAFQCLETKLKRIGSLRDCEVFLSISNVMLVF